MKHRTWILIGFFLTIVALGIVFERPDSQTTLGPPVVFIDPGHGGKDGGTVCADSSGMSENEYAYDISLRLKRIFDELKWTTVMTIVGEKNVRDDSTEILSEGRPEKLALDGSIPGDSAIDLMKRVAITNKILDHTHPKDTFLVSFHLNNIVGKGKDIRGAMIIFGGEGEILAKNIGSQLASKNYLRKDGCEIVSDGAPCVGKRILILSPVNRVGKRVLIELANFNSSEDCQMIRNPVEREKLAILISRGVVKTL